MNGLGEMASGKCFSLTIVFVMLASLNALAQGGVGSAPSNDGGHFVANPPAPSNDPLQGVTPDKSEDWTMFGHDQQRTGWANSETQLSKANAGKLGLVWSTQLSTPPRSVALATLTSPLVVGGIQTAQGAKTMVYTVGADDTLFAIDAENGKVLWQRTFKNELQPARRANWLCSNTEQATPVIDKANGAIYFTTSDGNLRAAGLADGNERMTPTPFVAPFSRNWSLNLIGHKVYTATGRGCGGDAVHPIEDGNIAIADVSDPRRVTVQRVYTGHGRPAGGWSRSGPVRGPQGVYEQLADGFYDPAIGMFGSSIVSVDLDGRGITDSFTPSNWRFLNSHDLDLGSGSPVIFPFKGRALLSGGAKEGVVYLLDANALGGAAPSHSTPLYVTPKLGNDLNKEVMYGIWGAQATYENDHGDRYIYVPMWGPPSKDLPAFQYSYGPAADGSVMAFQVVQGDDRKVSLRPAWVSRDLAVPDAPAVANGVVYAVSTGEQTIQFGTGPGGRQLNPATDGADFRAKPVGNEILYAFDAETGKELFSSKAVLPNWVHFNQPVVSHGKVFVVSFDAHVYAFGVTNRKSAH